ncbi:hypothetical protein [Chryseolinea lacunae]|uniref:Baseplate protein J-like domain-containing protein n=1 Tax=Chryseolinea lacunae TaxID=2801331 RepID=A0ABS1KR12_9BACT|nr:hypothetical protein [Chryseolinea lacunae]MBL0741127.1 hypothetical protein [Chryseolinea lacunae]
MSCTDKNPLTREGTSLLNRVLAALSTGFAQVDERNAPDLLLFTKRYAEFINYYNANNVLQGEWQPLMHGDVSVVFASLLSLDVQACGHYKKRLFKRIKLAATDGDAKREFKFLFDLLFSLVKEIDNQFKLLPDDLEYKIIVRDVIATKLQAPLAELEKLFTDYKTAGFLDYTTLELDNDAPVSVQSNKDFKRIDLSPAWQTAVPSMVITLPALPTVKEVLVYITHHNLFAAAIDNLLNGMSTLSARAADLFWKTLEDYPDHSPHMALLLAFVKLFSHEQKALNTYTQRHLDFYYKEVLQLTNKAPEPDAAHLLFELQKPVSEHRLTKDTLLKGGKESVSGKDMHYGLTDDVVLNKAVVTRLHATQLVSGTKDVLKAAPIANSDDGQGAKLLSADKSWFTYGDLRKVTDAHVGFAVASSILFLNEGDRTIYLTVDFQQPVPGLSGPALYALNCFSVEYTAKKKWITPAAPVVVTSNTASTRLTFTIFLSADDAPFVPYNEATHKEQLDTTVPVLKVYLRQDIAKGIPYTLLSHREVTRVNVAVNVQGVKDLVLSHDGGAIDASKPFKPFGDFPGSQSGFYVGSKEVFQKNLLRLELNTTWKTPVSGPAFDSSVRYLRQGVWGKDVFTLSSSAGVQTVAFPASNRFTAMPPDFEQNEKLLATSKEGFLQLRLNDDSYSLANHLINISSALSAGTSITPASNGAYTIAVAAAPVPKEIVLNNLSLNYVAATDISLQSPSNDHTLLHLAPFGFATVSRAFVDTADNAEERTAVSLFQDIGQQGELFVGLENAEARQVVNLLFQVSDGSSNPLREPVKLGWYYLSANNNWRKFREENIIDRTNDLTQSAIVTLTLPADSDNQSTLLGKGLHWLKVTAHPFTDTVCKLIVVQAQAARATLVQNEHVEFRQILPANTISKLLTSDGALKKTEQPFDSFDGRSRESDEHFYLRVSERLRHKQRAITIWDYEHIILEKFQKIFKVKCLNHSGFYAENGEEIFCENYPGHVSIVTLPNLRNMTNGNPLRPYTPVGLLKNIEQYLKTITSPFVQLHVKNPQFEEIQLDFKVKFYDHLSEAFYLKLLNTEIEQFLCPWAFDNTVEITFGGKIYKSALLNFVEERPYVDFVTCFKMNHIITRSTTSVNALLDVEEATASTARSILVSYYDEDTETRHRIVSPATCTC